MDQNTLGNTGLSISKIGFGAFKIGRDQGTKYPGSYQMPSEDEAVAIVHQMLDLGINYIDTAPAYGLSEQRVGLATQGHPNTIISTKVGETFDVDQHGNASSTYAFDRANIEASVERSLKRLKRETLDIVFIHSDGDDEHILNHTDASQTLIDLRDRGTIRAIGLSGKTAKGFAQSLAWADAAMIEYSSAAPELASTIAAAHERGIGVVVKKALSSGQLPPSEAIRFVFEQPGVTSAVVGTLNANHMQDNIAAAAT